MINLRLCKGKVPIHNTGNVDVIVLVDFPSKEVFDELYKKTHTQHQIDRMYGILQKRLAGHTLSDCGKEYDISKERVRAIEAKFLRKMQEYRSSLTTDSL